MVIIRTMSRRAQRGTLTLGHCVYTCAVGKGGLSYLKREGDGATPIGSWPVVRILYRRDRIAGFWGSRLRGRAQSVQRWDGWCDAATDRNYNRQVRHPYPASAEALWRDDHLYDVIVVLGHNHRPRIKGRGSAIFMHLACTDAVTGHYAPTAGCIALSRRDLAVVLSNLSVGMRLKVV